jgi:hypothetical protein
MNTYTPDCWELIKLTEASTGQVTYKVVAGWYGGFAGSNSWKISSGIKQVIEHNEYFEMPQFSGSSYRCGKGTRRMSSLMHDTVAHYQRRLTEAGLGTLEVLRDTDPSTITISE